MTEEKWMLLINATAVDFTDVVGRSRSSGCVIGEVDALIQKRGLITLIRRSRSSDATDPKKQTLNNGRLMDLIGYCSKALPRGKTKKQTKNNHVCFQLNTNNNKNGPADVGVDWMRRSRDREHAKS